MVASTLSPMGRPKKSEPTEPVRLPRSLARKLRRLALHADMAPGDYLASKFGAAIGREHAKMLKELTSEDDAPAEQK
jgi:hypothetical protein